MTEQVAATLDWNKYFDELQDHLDGEPLHFPVENEIDRLTREGVEELRKLGLLGDDEEWVGENVQSHRTGITPGRVSAVATSVAAEPDWVDDLLSIEIEPTPRYVPYHAYHAKKDLEEAFDLLRDFSRRNYSMVWNSASIPGIHRGNCSSFPMYVSNSSSISNNNKEEGSGRINFPRPGVSFCKPLTTVSVPKPCLSKLPAWKKIGPLERQSRQVRELVLGVRFANLAANLRGGPSVQQWCDETPGPDVGFIAIDLPAKAAERFLASDLNNGVSTLQRRLRRSLEGRLGPIDMAAVWTRPMDGGGITLFLAMRANDLSDADDVLVLEDGRQEMLAYMKYGLPLDRWRVHVGRLGDQIDQLAEEYSRLADDDTRREWANGIPSTMLSAIRWASDHGDVVADVLVKRGCREREATRKHWSGMRQRFGLPSWFSRRLVNQLHEDLVWDPDELSLRKRVIDDMKRKVAPVDEGNYLVSMLDLRNPKTGIRFYRGSPAQFAALVVESGRFVADCYSTGVKAGAAKELYETIRDGSSTPTR